MIVCILSVIVGLLTGYTDIV